MLVNQIISKEVRPDIGHFIELKCYSCFDISYSTQCNETIRCPSLDHAKGFLLRYDYWSLVVVVVVVCDHPSPDTVCCDSDLCNDHFYRPTTTTPPPTPTAPLTGVVLVGKRQSADPQCEEVLPSACADIVAADPSVCAKECLYKKCPVACGHCKTCYSCDFVHDQRTCNTTTVCGQGELCGQISSVSTNAFGKRGSGLAGGCCNESLCNDNLKPETTTTPLPTTTPTTTTVITTDKTTALPTTQGVTTHDPSGRSSFYAWCDARCGRLVDVRNGAELLSVTNGLYKTFIHDFGPHSSHRAYMHTHFHLDAIYVGGRGWVWETSGQPVPGDVMGETVTATPGACAAAKGRNSGLLVTSNCNGARYVLCVLK
uniref:C-type lectin domain-containing protein n=1 Tax=Magallana gigas TaxID=29159 RepID=K1RLZ3_MAGGI